MSFYWSLISFAESNHRWRSVGRGSVKDKGFLKKSYRKRTGTPS